MSTPLKPARVLIPDETGLPPTASRTVRVGKTMVFRVFGRSQDRTQRQGGEEYVPGDRGNPGDQEGFGGRECGPTAYVFEYPGPLHSTGAPESARNRRGEERGLVKRGPERPAECLVQEPTSDGCCGLLRRFGRLADVLDRAEEPGEAKANYREAADTEPERGGDQSSRGDNINEMRRDLVILRNSIRMRTRSPYWFVLVELSNRWDGCDPAAIDEAILVAKIMPTERPVFGCVKREELALNRFGRTDMGEDTRRLFERTLRDVFGEPEFAAVGLETRIYGTICIPGNHVEPRLLVSHSLQASRLEGLSFIVDIAVVGRKFEVALSVAVLVRGVGAEVRENELREIGRLSPDRIAGFGTLRDLVREAVQRAGTRMENRASADWSEGEFHE